MRFFLASIVIDVRGYVVVDGPGFVQNDVFQPSSFLFVVAAFVGPFQGGDVEGLPPFAVQRLPCAPPVVARSVGVSFLEGVVFDVFLAPFEGVGAYEGPPVYRVIKPIFITS